MENTEDKKKRTKILIIIIIIAAAVAIALFLILSRGQGPDFETAEEAYTVGMEKLDTATDLSLENNIYVEYSKNGGEPEHCDVGLDVKLNMRDGNLYLQSVNSFSNIVGDTMYSWFEGVGTTYAWYKDGWLFLRNALEEEGGADERTPEDIFNVYTSGRVLLDEKYIISETIENAPGGGVFVTRRADPSAVANNRDSLLGTLAGTFEDNSESEFEELVLTMHFDRKGNPVEYGMHTKWITYFEDYYEEWSIDAKAVNVSTAPVNVEFPPDEELFAFYGYKKDGGSDASDGSGDAENEAFVLSILPPGSSIELNLGTICSISNELTNEENIEWFKQNFSRLGIIDHTPEEYVASNEMSSDTFLFEGSKDGRDFVLIILDEFTVALDTTVDAIMNL